MNWAFLTEDILMCHRRKSTCVNDKITGLTGTLKYNRVILHVVNSTCVIPAMTC